MRIVLGTAKVFALLILFFVIVGSLNAQTDSIYRLPAGTRFHLRMDSEISSKFSSPDDTFIARLASPLIVRNVIMIPAGTIVEGRILRSSRAAFGGKDGRIEFRMETLKFSEEMTRAIYGLPLEPIVEKRSKTFWHWAGAGVSFLKRGREARLKEDDVFDVELKKEVVLPVKDY
jgi:hypothetical protein